MGLRGLVEYEEAWYWTPLAGEIAVQGEMGSEVVADPVGGAADPLQGYRAALGVRDDSEAG